MANALLWTLHRRGTNVSQKWGLPMRAFLSHSSKDKGFVERVAELLKPGTYDIDSNTFDSGLLNSSIIADVLSRCDLFVLFLSNESVTAPYVQFEILLGTEFFARGKVKRFLVICIDEEAFSKASEDVKLFSIARRVPTVEAAAWLVQGALIAAASTEDQFSHPFIGREDSLKELESQAIDPSRPAQKALYVSGNFGTGRRTLVKKFFQNQYPQVGLAFPSIKIEEFDGLDEIYRKTVAAVRPAITAHELRTRQVAFGTADTAEKARQIAALLNSLTASRQSSFIIDAGGVLSDSGTLYPEVSLILDHLDARPHPPVSIISPRMVPPGARRSECDTAYCAVKALTRDEGIRLAQRLLRDAGIAATVEQISEIVELSDRHPYNFYQIVQHVGHMGLNPFLASPREFIEWKHRQSSEYLSRVEIGAMESELLGLLQYIPTLDFQSIVDALALEPAAAADSMLRLTQFHIVEHSGDEFSVSPAMRIAVERDKRVAVPEDKRKTALGKLAETLALRLDEGTAPISLIDAAVLAAIETGRETYAVVFLLPSHYVWLVKRHYDRKQYQESIRLAKEALRSAGRLSRAALVAACRFMCLSAARTGDTETFDLGIGRLSQTAADKWSRSNVEFLRGFNERMKGHLPSAEEHLRKAYELSPGNYSTARELAAVCLARGNLNDAENYARKAYSISSNNAYVLDILVAVLTRKLGEKIKDSAEVRELMEVLSGVGNEGGRSFFTTREAEIELVGGDRRRARKLAEDAISRTPNIFEPRRIYAEVLLSDGNFARAAVEIDWLRGRVNARESGERRTNYRAYLEIKSRYLVEMANYGAAKEVYQDGSVFSAKERDAAVKQIELVQMAKSR